MKLVSRALQTLAVVATAVVLGLLTSGTASADKSKVIIRLESCDDLNVLRANAGQIPGLPPGTHVPFDACGQHPGSLCIQCHPLGNPTNFVILYDPSLWEPPGLDGGHALSCGLLTWGHCQSDGMGGWVCNDSGSTLVCQAASEYWVQSDEPIGP
jgi:hypothetical protein